ncbi:thiamine diphosphokinase [Falsirhodobacter sp. alg1]|uniref:thiamine diphosphokinase n=1 Tax=Falsirhodobacter sp. alg1 TaxID=1472418 RepID=UPI0005EF8271|nr:thiamine diphosphokinase [Falsirhodobacter sp. alg1]
MTGPIVQSAAAVTLVAGGPLTRQELELCLGFAPYLVAADGGADRAMALGFMPERVIGDLDSISGEARSRLADRLVHVAEQESTDFEKALSRIEAPFILATAVAGARIDHGFAVLNTLVRHRGPPCLLIGPDDVVFHALRPLDLYLTAGDRVSLCPISGVQGRSEGLEWPIDGLQFAPDGRIGSSNAASEDHVRLEFDGPGMLVILPRTRLKAALRAIVP